ncbi:MAG: Na+/H+ antiporter NhaC family protein [Puniceicoccaceae bacterium]
MKERRTWGLLAGLMLVTFLIEVMRLPVAAIWPSLAALLWVFVTRQVLAGLFGGALIGSILLADGKLWLVPLDLVEVHLLPNFQSSWKSGAIIFTLILGGFVHLLEQGGALQAFLKRLLHGESRRKVESGAGLFGLICFFDGLANSLMVGRIFQPMAEKTGVKKVRLAYIVDTTSAAVACLAFISTWIAYQLAMIREGFILAGQESLAEPYHLFFASLPHNYYAWFALILMAMVIWRQWDIGPMRDFKETTTNPGTAIDDSAEAPGLWRAWIPVAALLAIIFIGIYFDGTSRMKISPLPLEWEKLALSFAEANVPAILVFGSAAAAFLAWMFFPKGDGDKDRQAGKVFTEGMLQLFQPVLILIMAWMLSSTLRELGAADYLGDLLGGGIPAQVFPLMVFLVGSLVAFTTGTSWGTMGLLMPLAIPLAFSINQGDVDGAMSLMPMVVGAVFSGAVFGDHCSPFSDTTIVSSIACGVEPIDHVRTQIPYALIAGCGAAIAGFLAVGLLGGSALISPFSALFFVGFLVLLMGFSRGNSTKA